MNVMHTKTAPEDCRRRSASARRALFKNTQKSTEARGHDVGIVHFTTRYHVGAGFAKGRVEKHRIWRFGKKYDYIGMGEVGLQVALWISWLAAVTCPPFLCRNCGLVLSRPSSKTFRAGKELGVTGYYLCLGF